MMLRVLPLFSFFFFFLLLVVSIVSGNNIEAILSQKPPKAINQYDADQFDAHMQMLKDLKATFVTEAHHAARRRFIAANMIVPKSWEDTRKKQEVVLDPVTGDLIDVETGEIIPM
jgi:hypothetical protein